MARRGRQGEHGIFRAVRRLRDAIMTHTCPCTFVRAHAAYEAKSERSGELRTLGAGPPAVTSVPSGAGCRSGGGCSRVRSGLCGRPRVYLPLNVTLNIKLL